LKPEEEGAKNKSGREQDENDHSTIRLHFGVLTI
jgi:hypothetical protein